MTPFSSPRLPFATVGLDLDGTVVDTSGDLAAAVNHALSQDGRAPLTVAAIRPMIGGGARHLLAQALAASGGEAADFERLHRDLLGYYADNIAVHSRPFPHLVEALDDLDGQGVRCAIVTNKLEALALALLRALGLLDRFACVIGGDTLGPGRGKPAPDLILAMVERCGGGLAAFVGDSIYDVEAARAAGVPVIACSFGGPGLPAATLGAHATINDFTALVPALHALGRQGLGQR